jgi:hypothetical protein
MRPGAQPGVPPATPLILSSFRDAAERTYLHRRLHVLKISKKDPADVRPLR